MAIRKHDVIRFLIFRTLGNFFILFTIFGFSMTFGPAIYYEVLFRVSQYQGIHFQVAETKQLSRLGKLVKQNDASNSASQSDSQTYLGAILSGKKQQILVPKSTEFSVVIPKIGANENITANVDPSNPDEYLTALEHSVAHAKGSAFPGMDGNVYLFAHSADSFWNVGRYNAVFYLLTEVTPGDDIVIFFQNKRYDYIVYDKQIVEATDVSHIGANLGQGEMITLQTCWPPGTSWKRLLVFAKPKAMQ